MMVDETVDRFGRVDILVNNAGIWKGDAVEEISDAEWNEMIGINLTGTFNMIRAVVPYMKSSGGGRIINASSMAARVGGIEVGIHYTSAMAGLIGFVGLIVPHVVRGLVGGEHRRLIPSAAVVGGAFLVICDALARTLLAPREIPVGVVTALCGGPFFLAILIRKRKQGWLA